MCTKKITENHFSEEVQAHWTLKHIGMLRLNKPNLDNAKTKNKHTCTLTHIPALYFQYTDMHEHECTLRKNQTCPLHPGSHKIVRKKQLSILPQAKAIRPNTLLK